MRTIRASFQMAGFIYNLIDETRLVVSFSREAVRGQVAMAAEPAVIPMLPRVPIS